MRSLSPVELAELRDFERLDDDLVDARDVDVLDALVARGCLAREVELRPGGRIFAVWSITYLGRLALRVALPLPAVSP
jgi:hypothetical protein